MSATLDPLRPVDWVYQRAMEVLASQRFVSERQHGYLVFNLTNYLRIRQVSPTAELAEGRNISLHKAFQLRVGSFPRLRAAIEAQLLAGVQDAEIAATTGISETAVAWYAGVFFDVRTRLSATDFIINHVIETARRQHPDDWPLYGWPLVGFLCGPSALAEVMGCVNAENIDEFSTAHADRAKLILSSQLLHTAERMSPDSRMAADLLRAEIRRRQIVPNEIPLNQLEEIAAAVTKNLPFTVGEHHPDSPLKEFAGCAAELRTHDMMRLAAGLPLENAEAIKAMKLPPPGRRWETDDMPPENPAE